jgi:deazaflavin-dependent oxidoreductase (nitroreductase family)
MVDYLGSNELLASTQNFVDRHRDLYLGSGGTKGHIVDLSYVGARGYLPTLLLRTIGRKSGRLLIVPLIYGCHAGEWVVIGSKGGAPEHPAWYLNLLDRPEAEFQVATQAFRGSWRVAEGEERARVWDYMVELYPPYAGYQAGTEGREIPVVLLTAGEEVGAFEAIA